jgi:glycerol uptake facilitator-like aquaporin
MVHAMFVEGLGTAVLVFSLFIWTHRRNPVPGAAVPALVGMVYALLQAGLGPLTG